MASFSVINVGQFPNDQTGDTLRTAFQKVNQNLGNLSLISNVLTNATIISSLANDSVLATPNSLVVRDANASGYFANISANGVVLANVLEVNGAYELPTSNGASGQALLSSGNGLTYWGNVATESAPGTNSQIVFNSSGFLAGAANLTTDGSNISVGKTVKVSGGIVVGPSHNVSGSGYMTLDLSTSPTQFITLTGNSIVTTVTNPSDGHEYTFFIIQSGAGNYSWTWPTTFLGAGNISVGNLNASGGTFGTQKFVYNSSTSLFYCSSSLISNIAI